MPSPTSSLATQRPDLEASLEEFSLAMDSEGFIAHRVLRHTSVGSQAGKFGKIPIEQLLKGGSTNRAPGAGYSRGDWKFEPASYATDEHGWEEPVDDREAQMYANYFDAEVISTQRAQRIVLENQEKRVAAMIFNTSTYTPTAVTNEWDDATNATPIADVESKVQGIYDASGLWPNAMVITKKVFRNLRNVAEIVDRIKYQGFVDARPETITVEALAAALAIDNILVAGGTKNTANEGQNASLSPIWSGEYAWIGRVATSDDFREPCVGRIFHWDADGSQPRGTVETYRDETVRSDIVRVRHDVDEVELHTASAGLLSNITT